MSKFDIFIMCCVFFVVGLCVGVPLGINLNDSWFWPVDHVRCRDGQYVILVNHSDGTRTLIKTEEKCK